MPALPAVPQVLRARLSWDDDSDITTYNNIFLRYTGSAPSASDAATIASAILASFGAEVASWPSWVILVGCEVTDLTSPTSAQGSGTSSYQGTKSSGRVAGGTAVCVSYGISRRYRGGKPRNYFPWVAEADLETGQRFEAASVTAWDTAVTAAFSGILGTTVGGTTLSDHVNVSYYQGFTVEGGTGGKRAKNVSTPRSTPVVDTIVSRSISTTPASQRRRNR